ncbi:Fe2+-dependent dioxygenase [Iodidimonas sp. SYSU 1G8]|uniref:Fe2+-dependent dioxygenase n=1 Tax=Iodidimonas sp. SYSU 1G8 TaxID=3133967 RepID=UPI0031FEC7B3
MLLRIPGVLTAEEVAHVVSVLSATEWVDGRITAGQQAARAKHNLQVPEAAPEARQLADLVLRAMGRNALFNSAALPLRLVPPLFNRYDAGMRFDDHVDSALRFVANASMRIRTDVSTTLFLTDPETYDGGELVIQDTFGTQEIKLAAGDAVIYPSTSLHRVKEITRGSRWASFFWTQSLIRSDDQRRLLFELDSNIQQLSSEIGQSHPTVVSLTANYHNLLRMWAEI